jgi:hypothetical protein
MTAKENARRIIRFDGPQRLMRSLPCYGLGYFGVDHEAWSGTGHECPVGTVWQDIWGTEWHKEHEGVMGFPRGNPLRLPSALRSYRWPDPDDERLVRRIYEGRAAFDGGDAFLCARHRDTLWEKSYMLVGMDNMMVCFHTEPEYAREILHHVMDFQLGIARHYLDCGVEVVALGDDLGTQTAPLLGPRIVEEFLLPEYRRLFSFYEARDVLVEFHSCGNVMGMLEAFVALGVDVLNPIQATANDLPRLRAVTQGRMTLHGAIPSDLVMRGIAQLGTAGGRGSRRAELRGSR